MLYDYYKILQCPTNSTDETIKKAYHSLAKQYHPDIMGEDEEARINFNLIKEAYETLTNPELKNAYLEKKWYAQSQGQQEFVNQPLNSSILLKNILAIEQYVNTTGHYNLDEFYVVKQLKLLLNSVNSQYLNEPINIEICNKVKNSILIILNNLSAVQINKLKAVFLGLNIFKEEDLQTILLKKKQSEKWNKLMLPLIVIVSSIILFAIFKLLK